MNLGRASFLAVFLLLPVVTLAQPAITKVFGAATIPLDGTTTLTFTISNPQRVTQTNVAFNDTLPAGLVVANPHGVTGSCVGLGTIAAIPGTGIVLMNAVTLAPLASCSFSVNVIGLTQGVKNNSVTIMSDQGVGNTAMASITVVAPGPGT